MIRRLEQVAALVVAAGLALVSYWLFFSWARGGGAEHRLPARHKGMVDRPAAPLRPRPMGSETAAGLEQPLLGGAIVQAGEMGLHVVGAD